MLDFLNHVLTIGGNLPQRLDIGDLLIAYINDMQRSECLVHGDNLFIRGL